MTLAEGRPSIEAEARRLLDAAEDAGRPLDVRVTGVSDADLERPSFHDLAQARESHGFLTLHDVVLETAGNAARTKVVRLFTEACK